MRLKNMYLTCKNNIEILKNIAYRDEKNANDNINKIVIDYENVSGCLHSLYNIECLKPLVISLLAHEQSEEQIYIMYHKVNSFVTTLKSLIQKVQTIIDLGDSMGFEEFNSGFDIKIPPNLTLKEVGNCIADIDKVLNQCPYLNSEGESIQFKNVDVGSTWLTFLTVCTGSTIILANLAKIVDVCVKIASHIVTVKSQITQYKTLNLQNELIEGLISTQNTIQDALVEKYCQELQSSISSLDPEENGRLTLTLDILSDWMSKGMEIHSAIENTQEVKDLFPTGESQTLLLKQIELLKDKN